MTEPYYDRDGITIYLGDNRQVLPFLGRFDLLLCDPPYGIGQDGGHCRTRGSRKSATVKAGWDKTPAAKESIQSFCGLCADQIIWGGNYFTDALPVSRGWLYWHKYMGGDFSDGELAWTNQDRVLRSFGWCDKGRFREHPTEKPINLMTWCLSFVPEAATILDPWMGSGTTLVAAKQRGLKATGIEINEKYCEIAVRRLAQGILLAV